MLEVDVASFAAGFLSSAAIAAALLSRSISDRRELVAAEKNLKAEIERRAHAEGLAQERLEEIGRRTKLLEDSQKLAQENIEKLHAAGKTAAAHSATIEGLRQRLDECLRTKEMQEALTERKDEALRAELSKHFCVEVFHGTAERDRVFWNKEVKVRVFVVMYGGVVVALLGDTEYLDQIKIPEGMTALISAFLTVTGVGVPIVTPA